MRSERRPGAIRPRAVFLDVDGTLYYRGEPIPGASGVLVHLRAAGITLRLLTNIDSQSPEEIAAELAAAGLPVQAEEIFTPVRALEELLKENRQVSCRFLLPATLRERFAAFAVTPGNRPDYVVLGDCHDCASYDSLNQAFRDLMEGAELVALQAGRYYERADGFYLDTGGFVKLLEYASGKAARVLGKPSPDFFELAFAQAGVWAQETLVVGDDLSTDVAGASGVGAASVLVRTGKFRPEILASSNLSPVTVLDSVGGLPAFLGLEGVMNRSR